MPIVINKESETSIWLIISSLAFFVMWNDSCLLLSV